MMATMHNKIMALFGAALAAMLSACSDNVVYQQNRAFKNSEWNKDSVLTFYFDSHDTAAVYDIILDLRTTDDYPYQNFWIFANSFSPDDKEFKDTLECVLADNNGRWIGDGIGSVHCLPVEFGSNVKFPRNGRYKFQVIQGMREDVLRGVSDVGLRIQKVK